MTRAVLSPAAERDVVEIVEWIASENPVAARGFRAALERLADTIGAHPNSGALKPQLASPGLPASSRDTSSSGRPSTPPATLISSMASSTPIL